jgi:DNA-directed RNA polymerase sigma subunit (sigma70/sigma32)
MQYPAQTGDGDVTGPGQEHLAPSSTETALLRERLSQLLTRYVAEGLLTERDQTILRLRLGLPNGRYATLQEVSEKVGVKRERVRQRQNLALRALRRRPEFADLFTNYLALAPPPASRHRKPPWLDRDESSSDS